MRHRSWAKGGRLAALDTLRGLFMTMIAAGHLLPNLSPWAVNPRLQQAVRAVLIGTIGFVTVSGLIVGLLFDKRPERVSIIAARYRRHAVGLLVIAHPLILLAIYGWKRASGAPPDLVLRVWFITDSFAVLFLAVVPFVARLGPRMRLFGGIGLLLVGRLIYVLPRPGSRTLGLLLDILAGADRHVHRVLYEDYPLLAMTGMFLIGSWLGRALSIAQRNDDVAAFAARCFRAFPWLLLTTCAMLAGWGLLRQGPQNLARAFLYPDIYFSTYPFYLALVLAALGILSTRRGTSSVEQFFAVFGRTSLFTYVVQYYLMQSIPVLAGWRRQMTLSALIGYLAVALTVMTLLSRTYERSLRAVRRAT